jgi:hypothetical protein
MFVPAPIDKSFVPYSNRSVLRRNAALIIDAGGGGKGGGTSRVVLQSECAGKRFGTDCGAALCPDGQTSMFACDGHGGCTHRNC